MKNANLLIGGATGSGKSSLTRALIPLSARVIVLDPMDEYEGDFVALDFDEASEFFLQNRWNEFSLVLRAGQEEQYGLLELAFHTQSVEPHGPLVVVMEEATEHSSTWGISGTVQKYYTKGRHARISTITIVQQDTDINRITKHSAAAVVGFWQNYLSSNWERFFSWEDIQNLKRMEDDDEFLSAAAKSGDYSPEQGRHFLVSPDVISDIYEWWWSRHGYLGKPLP